VSGLIFLSAAYERTLQFTRVAGGITLRLSLIRFQPRGEDLDGKAATTGQGVRVDMRREKMARKF
jgi:hypothetical protein